MKIKVKRRGAKSERKIGWNSRKGMHKVKHYYDNVTIFTEYFIF